MFGDVLYGLPLIGHGIAVIHLVCGDSRSAGKAFYAASRTVAVMVGGAMAIAGGLPGIVAAAACTGLVADAIATAASNRPHGLLDGAFDVILDIHYGNLPIKSVFKTSLYLGADALCGFGGALFDITDNVIKGAVEVDKYACLIVLVGMLSRTIAESCKSLYWMVYQHLNGPNGSSFKSESGSQPPNKSDKRDPTDSLMAMFLNIFNVLYLEEVSIAGLYIFANMNPHQKKSLKKLLNQLRRNGYLVETIEAVRKLSTILNLHDITFQIFLSLTQFVATYIGEEVARHNESQLMGGPKTFKFFGSKKKAFEERRQNSKETIANVLFTEKSVNNFLSTFKELHDQIRCFACVPSFRNIYSAMYHYYKHRVIPDKGEVLSVIEYFGMIALMLKKVGPMKEYTQLEDPSDARKELVFDRVFAAYDRRVRLVLRTQNGNPQLCSCYILDVLFEKLEEGEEFIDGNKK